MIWINIDGAAQKGKGAFGVVLYLTVYDYVTRIHKKGTILGEWSGFIGEGSNNMAEYMALLKALEIARTLGMMKLRIFSDSELLVKQINREYQITKPWLQGAAADVWKQIDNLDDFQLTWIPRDENTDADRLAKRAVETKQTYRKIRDEKLLIREVQRDNRSA